MASVFSTIIAATDDPVRDEDGGSHTNDDTGDRRDCGRQIFAMGWKAQQCWTGDARRSHFQRIHDHDEDESDLKNLDGAPDVPFRFRHWRGLLRQKAQEKESYDPKESGRVSESDCVLNVKKNQSLLLREVTVLVPQTTSYCINFLGPY